MNTDKNRQLNDLVAGVGNLDREQKQLLKQAIKASEKRSFASRVSTKKLMGVLAAFAILAGGSVAVWAAVDDDWGTSDVIAGGIVVPYDGFLMLGSDAANGTRDVTFELWDDEASTDPGNLIWSETQTVDFFNGRFSVGLGNGSQTSAKSIDQAILDGEQLYLAVQVKDNSDAWVALAGRQAIEAVPYSAWSANAADFAVNGDLNVTGDANITKDANITQDANVTGDVAVSGKISVTNGTIQRGGDQVTATNDLGLYSQVDGNWMRFVTNDGPFKFYDDSGGGTTADVTIDGGDLTVTGNISGNIGGNFTLSEQYSASVYVSVGNTTLRHDSDYVSMTPVANSICFLTYNYTGIDENNQTGKIYNYCIVRGDESNWRLRASSQRTHVNQSADTACYAHCLSW